MTSALAPSALARILLRYASGALVGIGMLAQGTDLSLDPDMVLVVGVALSAVAEAFYAMAKKRGWSL